MHALHLPRLGQTMESGTVTEWVAGIGDRFDTGDAVYVVETEKVETEVEAREAGRLVRILVEADVEIDVGTPLAVIADDGEEPSDADIDAFVSGLTSGDGDPLAAPTAAPEAPVSTATAPAAPAGERIRAVPKARKLASEHGIDLATVTGSGPDGRITVDDVRAHVDGGGDGAATPTAPDAPAEGAPLTGVVRRMADHLQRSWREIPHFSEVVEVDMSAAVARRADGGPDQPTLNDRLVHAAVRAAVEVPELNATLVDDVLTRHADVNISIAVATDRGLLTPVVRAAQDASLEDLSGRLRDLASRTRSGKLALDEMSGGTLTVSNLGMFGVDTGTPVVNHPQVALLFAGAVRERPVVVDGEVVARPTMLLTLACDHRVVDGVMAARYLAAVRHELTT